MIRRFPCETCSGIKMEHLLDLGFTHSIWYLSQYISPDIVPLAILTDVRPHTYKAIRTQIVKAYQMRLQQNSLISSATARHDRISWRGWLTDFIHDEASSYDLFDGQRIEEHDLCPNFFKAYHLSLLLSHTWGREVREDSYRRFSRCMCGTTRLSINLFGLTSVLGGL